MSLEKILPGRVFALALRLGLAAGLAGAAITTVVAGSDRYAPDPNDPFYKGSLCRHSPPRS